MRQAPRPDGEPQVLVTRRAARFVRRRWHGRLAIALGRGERDGGPRRLDAFPAAAPAGPPACVASPSA